jgi:hypothetical protein
VLPHIPRHWWCCALCKVSDVTSLQHPYYLKLRNSTAGGLVETGCCLSNSSMKYEVAWGCISLMCNTCPCKVCTL